MEVCSQTICCWQAPVLLKFFQKNMYVEKDRLYNCEWLPKVNTAFLKKATKLAKITRVY